jgi:hypothetical protein
LRQQHEACGRDRKDGPTAPGLSEQAEQAPDDAKAATGHACEQCGPGESGSNLLCEQTEGGDEATVAQEKEGNGSFHRATEIRCFGATIGVASDEETGKETAD